MAHRTANLKATSGFSHNRQSAIGDRQFFKQVYAVVRTIPRGKVLTYGQIATLLGSPYMARQVGWAMHGCPKGLPWQRVVGAGGKILINSQSIGDGPLLQRKLLELEGVRFRGQRIDMDAHQFIPTVRMRKQRARARLHRRSGRILTAKKPAQRHTG